MPPPAGQTRSLAEYVAALTAASNRKQLTGDQNVLNRFKDVFLPDSALFGPNFPIVPPDSQNVRTWQYPVGWNLTYIPRGDAPVSFAQLRALANSHDITRLAIETRKDQIEALDWVVKPRSEKDAPKSAVARCAATTEFFEHPDSEGRPFATWMREIIENVLTIDAPAFEVRRNRGGKIIALDQIDGVSIKPLLDETGRRPQPPAPAYEQVIFGRPWRLLTSDELIYIPRNPRRESAYGYPPVEQIITTVNIGIRRQLMQLFHFTEGNVPAGIATAPEHWTADQIKQFQDWFDSFLGNTTPNRAKIIWGPAGAQYQAFKEAPYKDEFDEWLARVVCYAFSLPPTAFTKQINRGEAESLQDAALNEGLAPLKRWVKRLCDHVIQERLLERDLEFAWDSPSDIDAQTQSAIIDEKLRAGRLTLNEARDADGLDPVGPDGDEVLIYLATGPVTLESVVHPPEPAPPETAPGAPRSAGKPAPGRRQPKPGSAQQAPAAAQGKGGSAQEKPAAEPAARKAADGPTMDRAEAGYVDYPVDGERCGSCAMFRDPANCTLVRGVILPFGHCRYWEAGATE
jgi:hypothetical protein